MLTGCIIISGCTTSKTPREVTNPSPTPTSPPVTLLPVETTLNTQTPAPEQTLSIFDNPVQIPPDGLDVSISVRKDPVSDMITVTFNGGKGQQMLKSTDIRFESSNGTFTTIPLGINRGDEVVIQGTKGSDRIQAVAYYKDGSSYHILDIMLGPNRAGITTPTPIPVTSVLPESDGIYSGPVTQPPNNLMVSVDVDKDPVYRVITTTFRGGHGQSLVKTIYVHVILSDGTEIVKELSNNTGGISEIQGTPGEDKVQVVVLYKNGQNYKVEEKIFGPRG